MNYIVKFNDYGIQSILSDCISKENQLFFKQGKTLYFDYAGEEVDYEEAIGQHYTTEIEQTLKKKPTKKWCIQAIKDHFRVYGATMLDDCNESEPFYSLAKELIEKHNL